MSEVLIRVLGPVDVVRGGTVVPIGSLRGQALLGSLVIAAGHLVSTARLEAAMWGQEPPPSADESLQTYVCRMRRLLGSDMIERHDHGYRLSVSREQIDALRFEDLLSMAESCRSEPGECLRLCREGLALWRGEPFGDLTDEEPFRLEALRLAELRVVAMELALGCELALGHSATAVAELECAVQEYPYRERLWYLLIEALADEDRRVEALRAGQRLRSVLAEVGLGPGAELQQLEGRIARADPAP